MLVFRRLYRDCRLGKTPLIMKQALLLRSSVFVRTAWVRVLFALLLLTGGMFARAQTAPDPAKPDKHVLLNIEGWSVQVDERLFAPTNLVLGQRSLRLLTDHLFRIKEVMDPQKVQRVQQVVVWMDLTNGELHNLQYHPDPVWLKEHGYNPEMAKGIHIPDASLFTSVRHQRIQPWCVLHELAHAYHDQVLGNEQPEIMAAWKQFVASGKYESVLYIEGGHQKHYALTNQKEFFAEMSETYFGQNDFYPFNRAELMRDEPELYALLQKIWGPLIETQTNR